MAGEYKSPCGCKIHVIQWSTKKKVVTQESCATHKAAPAMLKFITELSKATAYKSHPLGFEDSIDHQWKDEAADIIEGLK